MVDRATRTMISACPVTRTREDRQRALQVERDGQPLDDVAHAEPYGFTSRPKAGAEAVVVGVAGRSDEAVAVTVADRRGRPQDLAEGEVALWHPDGAEVRLSATGTEVTGALSATGNTDAASYSVGGTAGLSGTYTDSVTGTTLTFSKGLLVLAAGPGWVVTP